MPAPLAGLLLWGNRCSQGHGCLPRGRRRTAGRAAPAGGPDGARHPACPATSPMSAPTLRLLQTADLPAYKVQHPFPVFAIVGVRKPKLFIAEQVLDLLDAFEISAVIKHELGHLAAFDNLKRIMMHLCGDLLLVPVGRNLDTVWTEASEIAADEFAVNKGGRRSALNLASALIKIARNLPSPQRDRLPVGSYAVQHDGELLSNRIQRLLALAESRENGGLDRVTRPLRVFSVLAASLLILLPLALDTYLLSHVHEISEGLLKSLR
mgnify:CR=1 FL=1